VNVHNGEGANGRRKPARPIDGLLPLSGELAESYGMSYRQLWRKVRADPEKYGAEQRGRQWYLPVGTEIERERAVVTPDIEERVREDLRAQTKPSAIARRLGLAESTVYKIRDRHLQKLEEARKPPQEPSTDPPHTDKPGIPPPLKKVLGIYAEYLSSLRVSNQISEENQSNSQAYFEQRLLERWRMAPYIELTEEQYKRVDPAVIDAYVVEIAEKLTSDLEILYKDQNMPSPIEESSAAPTTKISSTKTPKGMELLKERLLEERSPGELPSDGRTEKPSKTLAGVQSTPTHAASTSVRVGEPATQRLQTEALSVLAGLGAWKLGQIGYGLFKQIAQRSR